MNPKIVTLNLSKTIPVQDYDPKNETLNKLVTFLANLGWDFSIEELKSVKRKYGEVILGSE